MPFTKCLIFLMGSDEWFAEMQDSHVGSEYFGVTSESSEIGKPGITTKHFIYSGAAHPEYISVCRSALRLLGEYATVSEASFQSIAEKRFA